MAEEAPKSAESQARDWFLQLDDFTASALRKLIEKVEDPPVEEVAGALSPSFWVRGAIRENKNFNQFQIVNWSFPGRKKDKSIHKLEVLLNFISQGQNQKKRGETLIVETTRRVGERLKERLARFSDTAIVIKSQDEAGEPTDAVDIYLNAAEVIYSEASEKVTFIFSKTDEDSSVRFHVSLVDRNEIKGIYCPKSRQSWPSVLESQGTNLTPLTYDSSHPRIRRNIWRSGLKLLSQ